MRTLFFCLHCGAAVHYTAITQSDIDTDWNHDIIGPILHSLTCSKPVVTPKVILVDFSVCVFMYIGLCLDFFVTASDSVLPGTVAQMYQWSCTEFHIHPSLGRAPAASHLSLSMHKKNGTCISSKPDTQLNLPEFLIHADIHVSTAQHFCIVT